MILAILQARYSSSRLPGKILKDICGKPMVFHEVDRLRRSGLIDKLVLATSIEASDDPVETACKAEGVTCFRGNLDDVLDRYYQCAKEYEPTHVVRVTGDCPLIDPAVVDSVIEKHINEGNDYTGNTNPPSFPDGLDVEIMTFAALKDAWQEARLMSEREHVTLYIRNHADKYKFGNVACPEDLSAHRWTVDEPEDFELVKAVYEGIYQDKPFFDMYDVLEYIRKNPEILNLNDKFERNEGLKKSLREDREVYREEAK